MRWHGADVELRTMTVRETWVDGSAVLEDAPPQPGQRIPGTLRVAGVAFAIGAVVSVLMWQQDWLLLYSDAQSHLTIARRIFDSQEPGFAQIGTVWLPFPHLLLLPWVLSYMLWQTGFAAAIVGTLCLGVSAAALWRITTRVGFTASARWATIAVFVLNPSLLYLHTVALTEPVLIAAILAALAGLSGWIFGRPPHSPGQLAIFAGAPSAAAVLTRYEGWAFVVVATLFVMLASWRRWRSLSHTLVSAAAFVSVPLVAILWWISFNWAVFGKPLDFIQGEYSAAAQQQALAEQGLIPTKGNLGLSLFTFDWTVVGFIGIPLLVLAAIGGVIALLTRGFSTTSLLMWLPGFIYPFAILSLFLGQTAIRNDHSLPTGLFNLRFAAGLVPLVALMVGVLVDAFARRWVRLGSIVLGVTVAVAVAFAAWGFSDPLRRIDVIREGYSTTLSSTDSAAASAWLAERVGNDSILIDEGANPVLMQFNIPLENIYARFTGLSYAKAVLEPSRYVTWIYVDTANPADLVWEKLRNEPSFLARFATVFQSGSVRIYHLVSAGEPAVAR